MNRRDWLRRVALVAAGTVAADQLELMERLTHRRRLFPSAQVWRTPHVRLYDGDGRLLGVRAMAWGRRGEVMQTTELRSEPYVAARPVTAATAEVYYPSLDPDPVARYRSRDTLWPGQSYYVNQYITDQLRRDLSWT